LNKNTEKEFIVTKKTSTSAASKTAKAAPAKKVTKAPKVAAPPVATVSPEPANPVGTSAPLSESKGVKGVGRRTKDEMLTQAKPVAKDSQFVKRAMMTDGSTPQADLPERQTYLQAQPPDISQVISPVLQKAIETANAAFVDLYITAGRIKDSEPLAAAILGCSDAVLELFAKHGADARYLVPDSLGMPLVDLRIKDVSQLESLLATRRQGLGVCARILLRSMPLEVIERVNHKKGVA